MINPATNLPFTTADVDRLLQLGDMFLEDWKENEGKNDPECAERHVEWAALRPLLEKLVPLLDLQAAVRTFFGTSVTKERSYAHIIEPLINAYEETLK